MKTDNSASGDWCTISNVDEIPSPALLIYHERVEENILRMIRVAGKTEMLWPHVKTHKMAGITRMLLSKGITKFKCATIAEAEMLAMCGAEDILLAYQPVGPNIGRFFRLRQKYPSSNISAIVDCERIAREISDEALRHEMQTHLWLDINNGMNRTGITLDEKALKLYHTISRLPMIRIEGLHAYDGHIHEKDFEERKLLCDQAFKPVADLKEKLVNSGIKAVRIIAGGSPTFPIHAQRHDVETSPGTIILWDYGYSSSYRDMDYLHAAVLLTRVVSKPAENLICLDLGHKAVGSEMPQPRIKIMGIENYTITGHNEEHMVVRLDGGKELREGDVLYAIPYHICPTVDRYDKVYVVKNGIAAEQWDVSARRREITV
ncbi:MAG: D-TA family PLP-dependent enzyme [Bacteroidales bacterium]|nr:D-TA family PLP-dependent enzyme [Bacteroidales bacterium]